MNQKADMRIMRIHCISNANGRVVSMRSLITEISVKEQRLAP